MTTEHELMFRRVLRVKVGVKLWKKKLNMQTKGIEVSDMNLRA